MSNVRSKKQGVIFAVLLVLIFLCMLFANIIQTDMGKVRISREYVDTDLGRLSYKLYVPLSATADSPAPAVLLLHGYQNDAETCAAYSIELARRGVVVMALDEYGHGSTDIGLMNRGYVDHKVTVNYGNDSEADGTYVQIGGANRYKLMMNFSNLSFFNDHYSKGSNGLSITDSSAGGVYAYALLADLPFTDSSKMAVSGHSMGTWSSWSVAAAYSGTDIEPKATVLQCGELFRNSVYDPSIHFNNVLLLQAKYDEFSYFRDYEMTVDDSLLRSDLRTEFLGTDSAGAAWNKTFGSFEDGSARRIELLNTNHRLTTHNRQGLATALDWFASSFGTQFSLSPYAQVAMIKEYLVMAAMLLVLAAMLPLMEMLLTLPLFSSAAMPLPPEASVKSAGKWWKGAFITILLSGLSYPFMTQLGHGLLPLPESIFRMTVGNGFLSYFGLLIIIMIIMAIIQRSSEKKKGIDASLYNRGLGSDHAPDRVSWGALSCSLLLAVCMTGLVYILTTIFTAVFKLDFRFIWPFFKPFTKLRIGQFGVYIIVYMLFFILSYSNAIAYSRRRSVYKKGFGAFIAAWLPNMLMLTGGGLLIVFLEYIPFFAGVGPGADLLFGFTFGGPFMSLLILFVPQILIYSIIGTYTYRRTGNVYTGAFTAAILACWIVTGGSSML
ncbi:MAG: lysophospholipase [Oscillospiraceae bacterium]|nr:lysophospholipase [Oscillospiraceae bacterium]